MKLRTRNTLYLAGAVVLLGTATIALLSLREKPVLRTGQIETREIDVASKIPGRLLRINVREGDGVHSGQTLFELSDREVRAKVAQANGAVDAARAQWDMTKVGTRPEQLAMARRSFQAAQSQFELADITWQRLHALYNDSLISRQEFDVVTQKRTAARAAMEAAEAQLEMAANGARPEERSMARAQFDRASQTLEEARAYFDESRVSSPIDGIVSRRYADPGELVSTGFPVVTIMDPEDMWAELNLPETELSALRVGDSMTGHIHGLDRDARFRVAHIAAMADFANWRAQDDRGTFEVRSFTVTLRPMEARTDLRPGMTVTFELPRR
jgi:HlyD family secretion protein